MRSALRALLALSFVGLAASAHAQSVQTYIVKIDASTVQPVGTGFVPANANGDIIVMAEGCSVVLEDSRFDGGWHDAAGVTRLDRAGQPVMSGMPYGALMGGFTNTIANYRYVGGMGAFHLLNAHVGNEFKLALNMSSDNLALMEGSVTATVIYIPAGDADVSRITIDSTSPAAISTGLVAGASEQFVVLPYGAFCPTGGNTYSGSCFGPEGLISYSPSGRPRPEGPYGALLGTFNGIASGAFHIGNGGAWVSQPADAGQTLSLMLNLPIADLAGLDGSFTVNVIRVPVSTAAVEDPIEVGAYHFTNGPNPMRDASTLRFELPSAQPVLVRIADVNGRWVRTLAQSEMNSGTQSIQWDGRDDAGRALPNGTYFCQLSAAEGSSTARIVIAR